MPPLPKAYPKRFLSPGKGVAFLRNVLLQKKFQVRERIPLPPGFGGWGRPRSFPIVSASAICVQARRYRRSLCTRADCPAFNERAALYLAFAALL
jgi:hypothetical protein